MINSYPEHIISRCARIKKKEHLWTAGGDKDRKVVSVDSINYKEKVEYQFSNEDRNGKTNMKISIINYKQLKKSHKANYLTGFQLPNNDLKINNEGDKNSMLYTVREKCSQTGHFKFSVKNHNLTVGSLIFESEELLRNQCLTRQFS